MAELEDLANLEAIFTAEGYTAGHQHGAIHGTIEGRALGRSKGFELWDELAYYDTQARLALLEATTSDKPDRASQHAEMLRSLVAQMPMTNGTDQQAADVDHAALLNSIRSRYRLFCSAAGIRPRVHSATSL